jgi:hypothetical protein
MVTDTEERPGGEGQLCHPQNAVATGHRVWGSSTEPGQKSDQLELIREVSGKWSFVKSPHLKKCFKGKKGNQGGGRDRASAAIILACPGHETQVSQYSLR